jgi:hypothetical protein
MSANVSFQNGKTGTFVHNVHNLAICTSIVTMHVVNDGF